jgi:hypothetical protein
MRWFQDLWITKHAGINASRLITKRYPSAWLNTSKREEYENMNPRSTIKFTRRMLDVFA